MKIVLNSSSHITFHPIKRAIQSEDSSRILVSRWDTDDTLEIDALTVQLITLFSKKLSLQEVARELNVTQTIIKKITYELIDMGFVKAIDHTKVEETSHKIEPFLTNMKQKSFRWIRSKWFLAFIFMFIFLGLYIGLFQLSEIPSYRDYFWTNDMFILTLSLQFLSLLFILPHELGHFFMTKAVGGEARIRISHRFLYIVFETESYHLNLLPKAYRYLVYLAGMMVDLMIISGIYLLLFFLPQIGIDPAFVTPFLLMIVLLQVQGIIWQFNVFLQTDMYNVFSDALDFENIQDNSVKLINRNVCRVIQSLGMSHFIHLKKFVSPYTDDFRVLSKIKRKEMFLFSIIFILGILFVLSQYVFLVIPRDITILYLCFKSIVLTFQRADYVGVIKNILAMLVILMPYSILLVTMWREKKII